MEAVPTRREADVSVGAAAGERLIGTHSPTALALKRALDLAIAVPACILLSPLFVALALAIRLDSPGPVFFAQQRRGRWFRPFTVVKFRSLTHGARDPHDRYEMLQSDPRITRVGAFLRATSLDELPQLFNVVAGTMSLVGPRPLVEWESRECLPRFAERFQLPPGITGLSQVEVRNSVDFDARAAKDVEYARRWSVGLDLALLVRTPAALLRGDGIYPDADS